MKATRRKMLVELLNGPRFNGDRSAFLTSSGMSKGRLTQLLDPDKPFGDVAAKNLCESLDLADGWFDSPEREYARNAPVAHVIKAVEATNNEAQSIECSVICAAFSHLPDDPILRTRVMADVLTVISKAHDPPSHKADLRLVRNAAPPDQRQIERRQNGPHREVVRVLRVVWK